MTTLSIIIISHNSLPMLERCLQSLAPIYERPDVEIIWIDNGSSDDGGAYAHVTTNWPRVRVRTFTFNRGVAFARNRGLECAHGKYLLILDDDTEVTSAAIDAMVAHLEQHPRCGVCAVPLVDGNGQRQRSFLPYPSLRRTVKRLCHSANSDASSDADTSAPIYLTGACQMIPAPIFEAVGPLDEWIFFGPEDADYCIRLAQAGYTVDYLADAPAIKHNCQHPANHNPFTPRGWHRFWGLVRFWARHRRI